MTAGQQLCDDTMCIIPYQDGTFPACRVPPPPRPKHLLLIAKWTGQSAITPRTKAKGLKHTYELVIQPDEPTMIGRQVRILAISPITFYAPEAPINELDTYDPHIVGTIVESWRADNGRSRLRVMNECRSNKVREVEMELPCACAMCGGRGGWSGQCRDEGERYDEPSVLHSGWSSRDDATSVQRATLHEQRDARSRRYESADRHGNGNGYDSDSLKCTLATLTSIRPTPATRDCLGGICWNLKRDLSF